MRSLNFKIVSSAKAPSAYLAAHLSLVRCKVQGDVVPQHELQSAFKSCFKRKRLVKPGYGNETCFSFQRLKSSSKYGSRWWWETFQQPLQFFHVWCVKHQRLNLIWSIKTELIIKHPFITVMEFTDAAFFHFIFGSFKQQGDLELKLFLQCEFFEHVRILSSRLRFMCWILCLKNKKQKTVIGWTETVIVMQKRISVLCDFTLHITLSLSSLDPLPSFCFFKEAIINYCRGEALSSPQRLMKR